MAIEMIKTEKLTSAGRRASVRKSQTPVEVNDKKTKIALVTSYPPRACGIATFSTDLERSLINMFGSCLETLVFPLESNHEQHKYPGEITHTLNKDDPGDYWKIAYQINTNPNVGLVIIQHEFGLFYKRESEFIEFLEILDKPVVITFHTVLPNPSPELYRNVHKIASLSDSIIVMTQRSSMILSQEYNIPADKIEVIPHGTHLVPHENKEKLKQKYGLDQKMILSTFGLLGPGKSIETTLYALPDVVKEYPEVLFLILGRTHPSLVKEKGEEYRDFLKTEVDRLGLQDHVLFINRFLPLEELLEYLQLTDIYLFTSKDPNQAVSGTFAYALSCGCPVISTPIPHALELLKNDTGKTFDFENSEQLKNHLFGLIRDEEQRNQMSLRGLTTSSASAWENSAIAHGRLIEKISGGKLHLRYRKPPIRLDHVRRMTTDIGMIQFSKINQPDIESGYTLDDNARALITYCRHYELTGDEADLEEVKKYFNFVFRCFRPDGKFMNYVDKDCLFTGQNNTVNLEDAAGRAIWSVGYMLSVAYRFSHDYIFLEDKAMFLLEKALPGIEALRSPRAIAFAIKGLYYYMQSRQSFDVVHVIRDLGDRLVDLYEKHSDKNWRWFEGYMTYGNSVLPHALMLAFLATQDLRFKETGKESFDFLLSRIFARDCIRVVCNRKWMKKEDRFDWIFKGGEQPVDVAYTILALKLFHTLFPAEGYGERMELAFNWFLGQNPLRQTIYNPCTSGCYDGLELNNVNLNQGAESVLSYLLARMAFENLPVQ